MSATPLEDTTTNGSAEPVKFSTVAHMYLRVTMASGVPTRVADGSSDQADMSGDTGVYLVTLAKNAARLLMMSWTSVQTEAANVAFLIESDYSPTTGQLTLEGSAATGGTAADVPDGDYLFEFKLAMTSPS